MYIRKIFLSNFRSFSEKLLEFSPKTTVIVGPNAIGKTNILESIYLISTGKSFRAKIEEEMIAYDEEIARVKALIANPEDETKLMVVLTRGEINIGTTQVEKVARKRQLVNEVGKRLIDFSGIYKVVLFGPWDMDLVTESPSIRRRFLDAVLSQGEREYRRAILSYEKGLKQRNRLLLRIREEGLSRSQLLFWDKLLIKNGDYISSKREEFIDYVNQTKGLKGISFCVYYDKSSISEARLEHYAQEEVAAATTLVGPHRDDFIFQVFEDGEKNKRDLARFGSRGEQRMGVLWLKLAELSYIEKVTNEKPTLLLDDIFSELDHEHRDIVFEKSKDQQTIITTADPHYLEGLKGVVKIKLVG